MYNRSRLLITQGNRLQRDFYINNDINICKNPIRFSRKGKINDILRRCNRRVLYRQNP